VLLTVGPKCLRLYNSSKTLRKTQLRPKPVDENAP